MSNFEVDQLDLDRTSLLSVEEQAEILEHWVAEFAKRRWTVFMRFPDQPWQITLCRNRGVFGSRETIAMWVEEDGRAVADLRQTRRGNVQKTRILDTY